jgi:large subunit ribosomal protein L5
MKTVYHDAVVPALQEKFGYKNPMQVPRLVKIVVNMGVGRATENAAFLETAVRDLTAITGQKPLVTKSKKSISNFKVRQGMSIGACVTLRGDRMYEFFDRLVNVALPRVRDFRGVTPKLSGRGDYTMGLKEQYIFPEIDFDKVERVQGMNVTVVTTANSDEEGRELLRLMGMPFRN